VARHLRVGSLEGASQAVVSPRRALARDPPQELRAVDLAGGERHRRRLQDVVIQGHARGAGDVRGGELRSAGAEGLGPVSRKLRRRRPPRRRKAGGLDRPRRRRLRPGRPAQRLADGRDGLAEPRGDLMRRLPLRAQLPRLRLPASTIGARRCSGSRFRKG
jgi:hypothetical protein